MTLLVCYAAGMRLSEATNLKVSDVDGSRGMIHIRSGKGRKDRLVPISQRLLNELLGHSSFVTTMIYLHCRRPHLERSPSPIDWLPIRQCPKWADPCQEQPSEVHEHGPKCPKCSQPMTAAGQPERRSWKKVFEGPDRPDWYRAFGIGNAKHPHWHRER